jgi:dTDP-4-dehydrorhamnose reductase
LKILIIGGSGVIGYNLFKDFLQEKMDVKFTYFEHKLSIEEKEGYFLNIAKKNETIKIIKQCNPDIVIHTAGITNVDICENNQKLADKINVEGTLNVIEGCKESKSKLIFLSTSAVFNGSKSEYFEEDVTSPISYYGVTKKNAEELVKNSKLEYMIIRIDQPYGWTEKWQHSNSVLRILNAYQNNKLFKEIRDWYNTPTFIPDIVQAIKKLISLDSCGIYHIVGADFINRYEWSLEIAKIFELDKDKIVPITYKDLNLSAKRANVNLNNQKFQKESNLIMKGIKEGLMSMYKNKKI